MLHEESKQDFCIVFNLPNEVYQQEECLLLQHKGDRAVDKDGWFTTGDIATICPNGYMQITDRSKDVIKSGGEWISSIEVENAATACPGVRLSQSDEALHLSQKGV